MAEREAWLGPLDRLEYVPLYVKAVAALCSVNCNLETVNGGDIACLLDLIAREAEAAIDDLSIVLRGPKPA